MIRREVKIGAMILVAFVILIWGFSFLKGKNIFVSGNFYYGVYEQVEGLNEGAPVYYKGFRVGSVESIILHPKAIGDFLVSFVITEDLPLPKGTVAQIYSVDLLGSMAVQLFLGSEEQLLMPGDTLKTGVLGDLKEQIGMEMLPLRDKTEILLVKLDTVLTNIGMVLSDDNRSNIARTIYDLHLTMSHLEQVTRVLGHQMTNEGDLWQTIDNVEQLTENLKNQSAKIDEPIANLTLFSQNLKQVDAASLTRRADSLLLNIDRLTREIQHGEGSLGMLIGDPTLYQNLENASRNLDKLLADMRNNPGRYLHFSAVSFGNRSGRVPSDSMAFEQGILFKIKIAESQSQINLTDTLLLDNFVVTEHLVNSRYIYTAGETRSYTEALQLMDYFSDKFKSSQVVSFQNGTLIPLHRALRKISVKN